MFGQSESQIYAGCSFNQVSGIIPTVCSISLCGNYLTVFFAGKLPSRFHWPSHVSMSIATTILEDGEFIEGFLRDSRRYLRSHRDFAAPALDEAGIPYAPGAYVFLCSFIIIQEQ